LSKFKYLIFSELLGNNTYKWYNTSNYNNGEGVNVKNKDSLIKDKNFKVPFNVLKKAMITTCLSATFVAGSMGFLAGCDKETIPSEVGFSNLTLYSGEQTPNITDNPGKLGDFYFETDTFNLYMYSEEKGWENLGSLQGKDGIDGTNGSKLYSGTLTPTTNNTLGEEGDYYIETDTFDFYRYEVSGWVKKGTLKGKDGSTVTIGGDGYWYIDGKQTNYKATGPKGDPGTTPHIGENGNWYIGEDGDTGVPVTCVPEIKDECWWVNGKNTHVKATEIPYVGQNGNWFVGTQDTGVHAQGEKGEDAKYIVSAERITDDYGIETKFKFTFSDQTFIETDSFNNIMENYFYPVRTVAQINYLFSKGVENIQLEQDITTTTPIVFPVGEEDNVKDICIDLNNFDFNYSYDNNAGDANRLKVKEYTVVTFKNGNLNINSTLGYTHATLRVMEKGSVVFDNVNYTSNGSAIVVWGASSNDDQVIKVRNSNIVGGAYALSTQNQHQDPTTGVVIELENSTFTSSTHEVAQGVYKYDTTGILINIPCHATIKNCEITGHKQAVIVRGGEVTIEDCKLVSTGLELTNNPNATLYNTPVGDVFPNWVDDGNDIPTATLVVGNYGNNAYNFLTEVNLINTEIVAKKFSLGGEIWAQANQGEGAKSVTINYDNTNLSLEQNFALANYFGEGVNVNIIAYDANTLLTLYEYGDEIFEGVDIVPVLNKDLVISDIELSVEDKIMIDYYNANLPQSILNGYQIVTPLYDLTSQYSVSVKSAEGLKYALENLAKDNLTITLNENIYSETKIKINSVNNEINATIDLNGNTIDAEFGLYTYGADKTIPANAINLTIMNGNIGNMHRESVMYGLTLMGDNNLFNVILHNVNIAGYEGGMATNGSFKNTGTIQAYNCTFVGNPVIEGETSVGAYLPGGANYTFSNCIFSGYDGIYTKNGNLNLDNCTIVATGEFSNAVYNGNGCTGTGSALIIDSAKGYGSEQDRLVVNISGGTLASKNGFDIYEVSTASAGQDKIVYYAEINLNNGVRLVNTSETNPVNSNEISKENDQVVLNGEIDIDYMIDENSEQFWTEFETMMNQPTE